MKPFDPNCQRRPIEIPALVSEVRTEWDFFTLDDDPLAMPWDRLPEERRERMCDSYARSDGTYNPDNGHFLCDKCYIEIGMPSAPGRGWKCP